LLVENLSVDDCGAAFKLSRVEIGKLLRNELRQHQLTMAAGSA